MDKGMSYIIKKSFAEAYLELAKTKPLKKISVSDLTKYCRLSRTTFYNHFGEKYNLLIWIYISHFDDPIEEFKNYDKWALKVADFFDKNKSFFTQAYKYTDFLEWHKKWIYNNICQYIIYQYGQEELNDTLKYQVQSYIYGAFAIFKAQLDQNIDDDFLNHILFDLQNMPPTIRKYFPNK